MTSLILFLEKHYSDISKSFKLHLHKVRFPISVFSSKIISFTLSPLVRIYPLKKDNRRGRKKKNLNYITANPSEHYFMKENPVFHCNKRYNQQGLSYTWASIGQLISTCPWTFSRFSMKAYRQNYVHPSYCELLRRYKPHRWKTLVLWSPWKWKNLEYYPLHSGASCHLQ